MSSSALFLSQLGLCLIFAVVESRSARSKGPAKCSVKALSPDAEKALAEEQARKYFARAAAASSKTKDEKVVDETRETLYEKLKALDYDADFVQLLQIRQEAEDCANSTELFVRCAKLRRQAIALEKKWLAKFKEIPEDERASKYSENGLQVNPAVLTAFRSDKEASAGNHAPAPAVTGSRVSATDSTAATASAVGTSAVGTSAAGTPTATEGTMPAWMNNPLQSLQSQSLFAQALNPNMTTEQRQQLVASMMVGQGGQQVSGAVAAVGMKALATRFLPMIKLLLSWILIHYIAGYSPKIASLPLFAFPASVLGSFSAARFPLSLLLSQVPEESTKHFVLGDQWSSMAFDTAPISCKRYLTFGWFSTSFVIAYALKHVFDEFTSKNATFRLS